MRVCIDARIVSPGYSGGVEQVILGIAHALENMHTPGEEYYYLVNEGTENWLMPYGPRRERMLVAPYKTGSQSLPVRLVKPLARGVRNIWYTLKKWRHSISVVLPCSDGTLENAGIDVIHFVTQGAFITSIPSLFHPWDLQHLHFPGFFNSFQWITREANYRAFCNQAVLISTATEWVKQDLVKRYDVPNEKVHVVPMASIAHLYDTVVGMEMVRRKYDLPEQFIFYPAQTWPHKNHSRLIDALASIRDNTGTVIPLVCTGRLNEHYPRLWRQVQNLSLESQVRFLGFISPVDLRAIFEASSALIFPSLFEGWGLPISEAFELGVPVACSQIPSLGEQVGDAALLFDPNQVDEIARVIRHVWTDAELRDELIRRGKKRAASITWDDIVGHFRDAYRRIYGARSTR